MTDISIASKKLTITAWMAMFVVSDLQDIIIVSLGGSIPSWIVLEKACCMIAFLALTLTWKVVRPLREYAVALLVLFLSLWLTSLLRNTSWFQSSFNHEGVSFFTGYAAVMTLDLVVAAAVITSLWLLKRNRASFFMVKGQVDAPISPIRWLGIKEGQSWKAFTWIFGGIAALAVLVPTMIDIAPSGNRILRALALLPAALLFSAVNAFTEETYYRANILSTLYHVVGRTHTLLITLVFFGLAHWLYGSPPGIVGFAMTAFLAWVMARSMLETKGMLSPCIIHFLPDVVIFVSYALLYVGP